MFPYSPIAIGEIFGSNHQHVKIRIWIVTTHVDEPIWIFRWTSWKLRFVCNIPLVAGSFIVGWTMSTKSIGGGPWMKYEGPEATSPLHSQPYLYRIRFEYNSRKILFDYSFSVLFVSTLWISLSCILYRSRRASPNEISVAFLTKLPQGEMVSWENCTAEVSSHLNTRKGFLSIYTKEDWRNAFPKICFIAEAWKFRNISKKLFQI